MKPTTTIALAAAALVLGHAAFAEADRPAAIADAPGDAPANEAVAAAEGTLTPEVIARLSPEQLTQILRGCCRSASAWAT